MTEENKEASHHTNNKKRVKFIRFYSPLFSFNQEKKQKSSENHIYRWYIRILHCYCCTC